MARPRADARRHSTPSAQQLPSAAGPTPPGPLAIAAVALVAATGIVLSVSNRMFDFDLWQHLAVGKAIWQLHAVPSRHLWTWPHYGSPEVLPSWLFRALLWPFWSTWGVSGLFAWRWLTTLATFGILWLAARWLGARGLSAFAVLVLCSLVYRMRSQCRPETLAAILLALFIWILEMRRRGGPDRTLWLIGIAWIWANAHISYYLGLVLLGVHAGDAWLLRGGHGTKSIGPPEASRRAGRLEWIAVAAIAISFLNPFGWRALYQPFEYYFVWRHEPIYRMIGELRPVNWQTHWRNGLPLLALGWPLLQLWRWRNRGLDRVELGLCLIFTAWGLSSQRFMGFYAIVAAPYVARDLDEWLATKRWAAVRSGTARASIAAATCGLVGLLEWTTPHDPLAIDYDRTLLPVRACDFMAAQGVRGHGFNEFHLGGYQIFRFWPERERLPFIDIHQTGSTRERNLYIRAFGDTSAWRELDDTYQFDYAVLSRPQLGRETLLDWLDADPSWALVFVDDVSALYVRRGGRLEAVARKWSFALVPGGPGRLESLRVLCKSDSAGCARLVTELRRAVGGSPLNADALSLLANVALLKGSYAEARDELRRALVVNPQAFRAHERLGLIALETGRPDEAYREFMTERKLNPKAPGLDLRLGQAARRMGNRAHARAFYRRELKRNPGNLEVLDSLAILERQP